MDFTDSDSFYGDYDNFRDEISDEEEDEYDELYTEHDIVGDTFTGDINGKHVNAKIRSDRFGVYITIQGSKHYLTNREVERFKRQCLDFEEEI